MIAYFSLLSLDIMSLRQALHLIYFHFFSAPGSVSPMKGNQYIIDESVKMSLGPLID